MNEFDNVQTFYYTKSYNDLVFTGADNNGNTLKFSTSQIVLVYVNGTLMTEDQYLLSTDLIQVKNNMAQQTNDVIVYVIQPAADQFVSITFQNISTGVWEDTKKVTIDNDSYFVYSSDSYELEKNATYLLTNSPLNVCFAYGYYPYSTVDKIYNSIVPLYNNLSISYLSDPTYVNYSIFVDNSSIKKIYPDLITQ